MVAGKFDRPEEEKPVATGQPLAASVVDDGDKAEKAESYADEKPLLGSEAEEPPAADVTKEIPVLTPKPTEAPKGHEHKHDHEPVDVPPVAEVEAVNAAKLDESAAAAAKLSSPDFEVGGPEELHLQGGVPVSHLEALKAKEEHKAKRAAAKALRKLQGKHK